jgi:hypothetical protein
VPELPELLEPPPQLLEPPVLVPAPVPDMPPLPLPVAPPVELPLALSPPLPPPRMPEQPARPSAMASKPAKTTLWCFCFMIDSLIGFCQWVCVTMSSATRVRGANGHDVPADAGWH